jgi:hypothetical protein
MPVYQMHLWDSAGALVSRLDKVFDDDLDALDDAVSRSDLHEVEVWAGDRRVARVKKGRAPLTNLDASGA